VHALMTLLEPKWGGGAAWVSVNVNILRQCNKCIFFRLFSLLIVLDDLGHIPRLYAGYPRVGAFPVF
jgi:hypothetical protein